MLRRDTIPYDIFMTFSWHILTNIIHSIHYFLKLVFIFVPQMVPVIIIIMFETYCDFIEIVLN